MLSEAALAAARPAKGAHLPPSTIRHDEDFVQLVGRSENASHYFRVDKRLSEESHHNSAPHSVIDRFEIGRFG